MDAVLAIIPECPQLEAALGEYRAALAEVGIHVDEMAVVVVDTLDRARELNFAGSPTFLADGIDLFGEAGSVPSLSCRLYDTSSGLRGTPGVDLVAARISEHLAHNL